MNARLPSGPMTLAFFIAFLLISAVPSRQLQARSTRADADIAMFYDALKPYGVWVSHRTYGTVWYPRDVPRNWRPYTDGHWAFTQQYGWLWVSDQPWGWAPFHYGRWAWDNWYGWIWVPGRTWAPAWVFWRSGGGYAAWAPMPPNVFWQQNIGLNTQYFNYDRDLYWDSWVTVSEYHLPHRHIHNHIFAPHQNRRIIPMTNSINNLTVINQSIVNQGVPVTQIERVTGTPVAIVVPVVNETIERHHGKHQKDEAPEIIRPDSAELSTQEEIRKSRELAIKLDQEKATSSQTTLSNDSNLTGSDKQEQPRVPGRLHHEHSPHAPHLGTNDQTRPETSKPAEQFLPDAVAPSVPANPQDQTSTDTTQPEFINQPAKPEIPPEALQPSNIGEQPAVLPVSPVNLSLPNGQVPSQSSEEKLFKLQPETTPLPGIQDQHPIEMPQPDPVREQEPSVQMLEEPIVDQQPIQPIQTQKISDREIIQPIKAEMPQQEGTAVQDIYHESAVELQPQFEPIREQITPVQMHQEAIGDQQQIQQQENPVVQELQIEQAVQTTQPAEPAPYPEIQNQPPIEVQQQPEPPHQPEPPVPQQQATAQPKNPCQPTEKNDCSK